MTIWKSNIFFLNIGVFSIWRFLKTLSKSLFNPQLVTPLLTEFAPPLSICIPQQKFLACECSIYLRLVSESLEFFLIFVYNLRAEQRWWLKKLPLLFVLHIWLDYGPFIKLITSDFFIQHLTWHNLANAQHMQCGFLFLLPEQSIVFRLTTLTALRLWCSESSRGLVPPILRFGLHSWFDRCLCACFCYTAE